MSANYILLIYLVNIFFVRDAICETTGSRIYTRFSSCREHAFEDDDKITNLSKLAIPNMDVGKPKGYLGNIGILGGAADNSGAAYYAGITALRVGADAVHIFCTRASAPAILSRSPDINVHPIVDTNPNRVYEMISKNDVVLIGPGLELEQHSINVINALIPYCKNLKKPIVFDLNEYFITPQFVSLLLNYPLPGLILTPNSVEFEKLYLQIKSKNSFSDSHVNIDFPRIGENIFIYRKGCTDMGFSKNPLSSWALSQGGSPRRVSGQGSMIAGATAIYFNWALKTIHSNTIDEYGSMVQAGIATNMAAKLVRNCNRRAYEINGKGALTSDMVTKITDVLYRSD